MISLFRKAMTLSIENHFARNVFQSSSHLPFLKSRKPRFTIERPIQRMAHSSKLYIKLATE